MEPVFSLEQLDNNVIYFDTLRLQDGGAHRDYVRYVERGTVFLPYLVLGTVAFAPSRFIGYAGNTLENHTANADRDGRVTTPAITEILQHHAREHQGLEQEYQIFCDLIGAQSGAAGAFGAPRRFWNVYRTDRVLRNLVR